MKTAGLLAILISCLVYVVIPGCKEATSSDVPVATNGGNDGSRVISREDFEKGLKRNGVVVLDVRHQADFEKSHIPKAININFFDPEFKHKILDLDRNKPYYVYCKNEVCSYRTMEFMKKNDFKEVYTLQGGYEKWKIPDAETK